MYAHLLISLLYYIIDRLTARVSIYTLTCIMCVCLHVCGCVSECVCVYKCVYMCYVVWRS